MPTGRLSMRRIRDVLRLKYAQGLSERAIAVSLGLGKGTVGAYLGRARTAGLAWPLPDALSDDDLDLLLFPATPSVADGERPMPDWSLLDRELRRPGVTRALLWEEYRAAHPFGFGYAWFCEHYKAWKGRVRPTMRQTHIGGEKVFVDFAGDTVDVINPATGEVRAVKLFVAAMGASNYTYAEAVASEGLEDWIEAHVRMFTFLGGVPKVVVPDNLKSAVFKADRFDPGLNRTYAEMAGHYGTAILPARPYKPRDKAKVEVAVQVAHRWILARLRNLRFFSLADLNAAIRRLLDELNVRVMRGYRRGEAALPKRAPAAARPGSRPAALGPEKPEECGCGYRARSVRSRGRSLSATCPSASPAPRDALRPACAAGPRRDGHRVHVINYHHVIHVLRRKPQALWSSIYRDSLYPRTEYAAAWRVLQRDLPRRDACRRMVDLLFIAHDRACEAELAHLLAAELDAGRVPDPGPLASCLSPRQTALPRDVAVVHPSLDSFDALLGACA